MYFLYVQEIMLKLKAFSLETGAVRLGPEVNKFNHPPPEGREFLVGSPESRISPRKF